MLSIATNNIRQYGKNKIQLVKGDSGKLPFPDNCFDLVTAIVAPAYEPEVFRVLKPGGRFLLEATTEQDQKNIKEAFGKDDKGWRCSRCSEPQHNTYIYRYQLAEQWFDRFSISLGRWKTWYSMEALLSLLEQIPWIREYSPEKDMPIIDRLFDLYATDKGLETTQERILVIARKDP